MEEFNHKGAGTERSAIPKTHLQFYFVSEFLHIRGVKRRKPGCGTLFAFHCSNSSDLLMQPLRGAATRAA
jgi:hypothetical protein